MQRPLQSDIEQQNHMTTEYDLATWNMYARIVSTREARARCGICMGSMEENHTTIMTVGEAREMKKESNGEKISKSSEEQHLIRTTYCLSPLYLESTISEKLREPALMVHQECNYGATAEQTCRNLIMSEDNIIFQLDL